MNNRRYYLDVHVLQTVPPSCVNRDDTGSPKTALYGGVTRARVSSQSWKRAVRLSFRDDLGAEQQGYRTKRIVGLLAKRMQERNPALSDQDAETRAIEAFTDAGLKIKSADKGTDALFFISAVQLQALAEADEIKDMKARTEARKAALKEKPSVDMALFGRMVADDASLNVDAAVQVAHSISTHAVTNEFDYFTAVDDRAPEDNAGAGHIGTVEFNSSTLYRYATVNVDMLLAEDSLGADTPEAVRRFVEAFIRSMPTGKQNTFANLTPADAVYIAVRRDQPVNLVNAFERPVPKSAEGFVEPSKKCFLAYADYVYQNFVSAPEQVFSIGFGQAGDTDLKQALNAVEQAVRERLTEVS